MWLVGMRSPLERTGASQHADAPTGLPRKLSRVPVRCTSGEGGKGGSGSGIKVSVRFGIRARVGVRVRYKISSSLRYATACPGHQDPDPEAVPVCVCVWSCAQTDRIPPVRFPLLGIEPPPPTPTSNPHLQATHGKNLRCPPISNRLLKAGGGGSKRPYPQHLDGWWRAMGSERSRCSSSETCGTHK